MSKATYETFELLIGPRRRGGYPITIIDSPAGESRALCRLDSGDHELQEMLTDIVEGYSDTDLLKEFGGYLFSRLFVGKVKRLYRDSLARVQAQDKRLRVRLRIEPPELAALPWEYLYDEETDKFLAISAHSALIRYIPMEGDKRPSAVKPPLRILVAISNPIDYDKLDVEQEKERIEQALAELIKQGVVELQLLERASLATLRQAIHRFSPHVFHYIGHSVFDEERAYVILTDEDEHGQMVDEQTFSQLFDGADEVRLAVLNGCQSASSSSSQLLSGLAANLLKHELSAVVAMQYPIADEAALLFSAEFYSSLAAGYPIEAAITETRKALFMDLGDEGQDWGIPVLFLRADEGLVVHQAKKDKSILEIPAPDPCHPPEVAGFVGRESELAYYSKKLINERIAVISGMAGVGKTALAGALAPHAPPRPIFWHTIHASDSVQSIIWKMAAFLAWHEQAELWQMMNLTLQGGGKLPPASTLLDYVFQMIRQLSASKGAPLLCFDDFHHLDNDPLLDAFKEQAIEAVRADHISIIITSRGTPDFVGQLHEEPLMGLSAQDTHLLLHEDDIDLSDELIIQLHTISDGNAQLLMLAMQSLKRATHPALIISNLVETDDIERYLLKEVDETLTHDEREVECTVAVLLGYPGSRDAIEEISERSRLRRILADLTGRYLLTTVARSEKGRQYGQHALLRTFFYDLLSRRERRAMHQRAAEYYEEEEEDFLMAILHYERARDHSRAAELATSHTWQLMNLGHTRPLLELLERLKKRHFQPEQWAAVTIAKAELYMRQAEQPKAKAKDSLQAALAILEGCAPQGEAQELEARACYDLASVTKYDAPKKTLLWIEQGIKAVADHKASQYMPLLQLLLGSIYRMQGDYASAQAAIQEGIEGLSKEASQSQIDGLLELGIISFIQGNVSEAKTKWEAALALSEQLHDSYRMITILGNLSLSDYSAGDWPTAIAKMEKAVALAERVGNVVQHTRFLLNHGSMLINSGDDERAEQKLIKSRNLARTHGLRAYQASSQLNLADLYLRRGQTEQAERTENKVYRNQGGQLERVASWKSNDTDYTYGVAWGDVDADNDLDLAVVNNGSPNKVYLNHQGILSREPFWSSKDNDFSESVAWGDMDNDGDLDLAVGNRYGSNKVYLNQNGILTTQAFWASDDKDITRGIAWGDVDGDGDLDLASGNDQQTNKLYLNLRTSFSQGPVIALTTVGQTAQANYETALKLAPADFYALPTIQQSQIIPIPYTLFHPNSEPMQVRAFYSLNGGGKWLEAKPTAETKRTDLKTSPSGMTHTYLWDVSESGFFGQSDNVIFRLEAQASLKPITNTVPGPFQHSYVSAQTYPFRVRGSQVRVLNASQLGGNALVYRLSDEQMRDGNVLGKSAQEPFRTDSEGYLQGRGELAIGDTLVAMLPLDNGLHSFDGHDDYVEIDGANGRQFNSMTNSITVEAVMKPRLLSRDGHIVNRGGGWDESGYSLFLYGKKIRVELQNSNTQKKAIVDYPYPDDNQCHHVAFTWDSGSQEIRTYIDGQLQREIGHFEGPIDIPEQKLNIGRNESQDGYYFDGLITEVRLWKVARSQEELQRDINQKLSGNEVGLVGYWRLNEQAEGVTHDQTPQRNHGRGQGQLLNNKETIVKQDPCAQSYTLYYTSATPSEKGVSSHEVKQLGVQTVTVSADNSLLLFNLDISLEWDARQDQFMRQLEYDLRRVSELLYDWTDGQAALGELTIYHDRQNWHEADIRIYATNRLRPNADIGGIVKREMSEVITDSRGTSSTISYKPGQLRMGVIWNRYGNSEGTLGEDWPRALAHELGHYLFFLNDNYLGFDEQKHLVSLEGCYSAMSDPYREDYSEFVTEAAWLPDCKDTLSQRPDWETISKFYPLQPPTLTTTNPGPHILPLDVTKFNIMEPERAATTLQLPIFYLTDQEGKRVIPSKSARAYLFRGEQQIISLGSPVLDQVIARGASPGERLCLYDLEAKRLGCEEIQLGDEQIELKEVEEWQPDVIVSPVTSRTIEIEVAGELPKGVTLEARFFGIQNHVTQTITLTPEQHYRGSFDFSEPTLAAYIHVWVVNDEHSRQIVTSYGLGGAPIKLEFGGAGAFAPVISPDGQVILYGDKLNFAKGEFLSLQTATKIPQTPPWGHVVGDAYRLIASENVGRLEKMSITFNYLEQDVLAGEEQSLRIYYRAEGEQSNWQALTTTLDIEHNFASASIQGAGVYALISGLPIKLETGWNLFAYPLWTTQPITEALKPIDGKYTIVCSYEREDTLDPWKVYRVGRAAEQNDLQQLEYGRGYWIKVTEPITLSLRGEKDQARFTNAMIRDTLPPTPDECEAIQKRPTTLDIIYIVQPDDTMYRIAKSHQTTVKAIKEANHLPNAYLEVGQRLIIPGTAGR